MAITNRYCKYVVSDGLTGDDRADQFDACAVICQRVDLPHVDAGSIQATVENFPSTLTHLLPMLLRIPSFARPLPISFCVEFQLASGVVPTSGAATSQYDAWVAPRY